MYFAVSLAIAFALVMGCATTSPDIPPPEADILPPAFAVETPRDRQSLDYFLLKMADANTERRVQWWVEYRRAKLWSENDPKLACEKWKSLSQDEKFPLRQLSLLRAIEICAIASPQVLTELPRLEQIQFQEWLKPTLADARLAQTRAENNLSGEYALLIEKSMLNLPQDQKLALVEEALKAATSLNDQALIEKAKARREKIAPRFLEKPSSKYWLKVAHDFRRARDFENAKTYYSKVVKNKKFAVAVRVSALKGLAQTFKTERNKSEYINTLERVVKMLKPKGKANGRQWNTYASSIVTLARAEWTENQIRAAQDRLEKSLADLKGKASRAEVFWVLGRMQEERQDFAKAIDYFEQAAKEARVDSSLAEKIDWYLAWNLRKLGRLKEATEAFQKGRSQASTDFSKARFHYWLGRTYLEDSDLDNHQSIAKAEFATLIDFDPLGYYGLLAHHQLGLPIKRPEASKTPPSMASSIEEHLPQTVWRWLLAVDELDVAQDLLAFSSESLRKQDPKGLEESTWTDLFRAYAQAGSYQSLYERLGVLPPEKRQNILANHPEILFPQPWRVEVENAASQVQLPPELLFSIMRQESSFNPRARSPADAFGLMQLLPEIARSTAKEASLPYERAEDLYEPEINIPIGAHHIRELWDRFSGRFILAVASYNASERSIRNWMKVHYQGDSIQFIEEIPYEETRGYIRLVMRNMIFYQLLQSDQKELAFPEWVLKL